MFEGEKQTLFWLGLTILGFASILLFTTLCDFVFLEWYQTMSEVLKHKGPYVFGAVVFILIGLYMMKSGTKKP